MQTELNTAATVTETAAIVADNATPAKAPKAPAKPKAAKPAKAKAPATVATPAKPARVAALETHDKAGFTGLSYAGLSKPRNSGITKAPNLATSKAAARTFAQLTERMHKSLSELARAYAGKAFPVIGIDRGQAAIFLASGFLSDCGGGNVKLSAECIKRYTAKPKA